MLGQVCGGCNEEAQVIEGASPFLGGMQEDVLELNFNVGQQMEVQNNQALDPKSKKGEVITT